MIEQFLFAHGADWPRENDDVIGCIMERPALCVACGKEDCIYRGSMRCEVEEVA